MKYALVFIAAVLMASCSPSKRYYTSEIDRKAAWTGEELKKIQFFISGDIVLWRDVSGSEASITKGKIRMVNGRKVEEIVIKKGTPGMYLFSPEKDHYAIGFDAADDNKYLVFGPARQVNGRYVLLAKEWGRNGGKVTYGDKVYQTGSESAYAFLLVDMDHRSKTKVTSENATGRKVQ